MRNEFIRISVRTLYDMQKLRIQNGNRIAAAFRTKLGLESSQAEEENADAEKILDQLREEYKRITDGVKRVTKNFKTNSTIISTVGELSMIESYEHMLKAESTHEKAISDALSREPIYTHWLLGVRGVGPLMAGVILSEIDIEKCNSISALHAYCGLDVVVSTNEQGEAVEEGRCRKRHHLKAKTYTNRDGEETETVGITFNPFLKTKLVGVLGGVFLKLGGEYRAVYDDYKHRLEHHPKHKEKTKGHRHNMAIRYMVKEFLADLWTVWRTLEGLPVRGTYGEDKLGIVHSKPKRIQDWLDDYHAAQIKEAA
jgi:hypothetical protein